MNLINTISNAVAAGAVEVYNLAAEINGGRIFVDSEEAQRWAKGWACWFCYQHADEINAQSASECGKNCGEVDKAFCARPV